MTIRHHLEEHTLLAYATGDLPEAFNLIIAAHVSLCDQCRATVESLDALGGAVMNGTAAAEMPEDSLARTLAQLDALPLEPRARTHSAGKSALPAPLRDYVGGDLEAVRWRRVGMGVKQAILPTSKAASARLLLIPAGVQMPDHSHSGTELTLVLQGAFRDGDECFARGDIEVADGSVSHMPVAEAGADCICLAVTDAPLRFKGWLPRIAQKFLRI